MRKRQVQNTRSSLQAHYSLPSVALHAGYLQVDKEYLVSTKNEQNTIKHKIVTLYDNVFIQQSISEVEQIPSIANVVANDASIQTIWHPRLDKPPPPPNCPFLFLLMKDSMSCLVLFSSAIYGLWFLPEKQTIKPSFANSCCFYKILIENLLNKVSVLKNVILTCIDNCMILMGGN